jgi:hypothetical protein
MSFIAEQPGSAAYVPVNEWDNDDYCAHIFLVIDSKITSLAFVLGVERLSFQR